MYMYTFLLCHYLSAQQVCAEVRPRKEAQPPRPPSFPFWLTSHVTASALAGPAEAAEAPCWPPPEAEHS